MSAGGQPAQALEEGESNDSYDVKAIELGLGELENQGVAALPPLSSSLEEFYTTIATSDGRESKCKVIRPKSSSAGQKHPLIVYFHGGGYSFGSPEQVTRPAREFAIENNATIVCPSYRHTPDHPWPQPMQDGWDIVSYLSHHAETDARFGSPKLSDGFVVGGVSAGGGQAGIIGGLAALAAADPEYAATKLSPVTISQPLPKPITGLFVAISLLLVEEIVPPAYKHQFTALEDNKDDANINTAGVMGILRNLQCTDYTSPWFSPVNVLAMSDKEEEIAKCHPRTYVQSCAKDPLRDDSIIYEKMLSSLGGGNIMQGKTKIDVFPDDGHAAWTALPFESVSKNPTVKEATLGGMRWLLQGN